MNRFEEYCSSYITPQMTLLEKFNALLDFLKQNKETNLFLSEQIWQDNIEEFQISDVVLGGYELKLNDIVLFKNGYYSYVKTIGSGLFTIGDIRYFVGEKGETGTGVSHFSIDINQHLIVYYDNGTTQDLGSIFSGNVNINGNFTANSIIENMSGYSYSGSQDSGWEKNIQYAGVVKNGNKLTMVCAGTLKKTDSSGTSYPVLGNFYLPVSVADKIIPLAQSIVDFRIVEMFASLGDSISCRFYTEKPSNNRLKMIGFIVPEINKTYTFRYELTFLLNDSLAG